MRALKKLTISRTSEPEINDTNKLKQKKELDIRKMFSHNILVLSCIVI